MTKARGALGDLFWIAAMLFVVVVQPLYLLPVEQQLPITLTLVMVGLFLKRPTVRDEAKASRPVVLLGRGVDLVLIVASAVAGAYVAMNYAAIIFRQGAFTPTDNFMAMVLLVLVLEGVRRAVGWPLTIVCLVFILYALFGRQMPGPLLHRGYSLERIGRHLALSYSGIYGIPLAVMVRYVILFIVFGALLQVSGAADFLVRFAQSIAGRFTGGLGKVAVVSSALVGTISGSAAGNVATTGSVTIPAMKRGGYQPHFAGAIESVASTGGQIMPPIMGAAAFLMAEFTGLPYSRIIAGAAIPALLYYFGVWSGVHYEAKKLGLKGLSREDLPKFKRIMLDRGHLIIPLVAIIYLLVTGFTPMKAALWAIILSILSSMVRKATRIKPMEIIKGLEAGARGALGVIAATACAGIIIGVVTLTGLGLKLGSVLVEIANGNLLITLFFTMLTSILLGMGVPTTANYVITSTIAAPAIVMIMAQRAGLDPFAVAPAHIILPAHMFAFYFGIIADVTPPVALAAFAGAGIAKANPMKTGVNATKLAIAAFLVPYIFVMSPQMLLFNVTPIGLIWMLITSLIGITAVSGAVNAWFRTHMNWIERIAAFAGGLLMIYPGLVTDSIGLGLCGAVFISQQIKYKKKTLAS